MYFYAELLHHIHKLTQHNDMQYTGPPVFIIPLSTMDISDKGELKGYYSEHEDATNSN